jgi:hypothetical protein
MYETGVCMRSSYIMFLAPALACLAISGCGGSGPKGDCDCPANRTIVTVKFAGTPTAVATQIGSGSFTAATLSSGSVTLSVPAGTTNFAVAYVCQGASTLGNIQTNYTYQYVFESSTADGTSLSETCAFAGIAGGTGNSGTLTGSVDASAIPGANYVGVEADNGSSGEEDFIAGDSEQFSESLPAGTDRVAVEGYVYTAGQNGSNAVFTLAAVRNFDGVSVPGAVNSGNTVTLGAADQVTTQPITYNNAPGGFSTPTTVAWYEWNGGGGILLSNGATNQYPVAPAGAAESGDFYDLISTTSMSASSGVFEAETIETNTASGSPLAVNFPAPWSYSGPTPSAQPTFDMANSSITGTTGVTESGELEWFVPSVESTSVDIWSVSATGNYLNGSTSLAFPNLGGLTGFVSGPASGDTANWFAFISKSSAASGQSVIPSGTITSVETSGSFTVP